MGKTISITIPKPLEKELKEESTKQGISRSRFICNILMGWSEDKKNKENLTDSLANVRMKS